MKLSAACFGILATSLFAGSAAAQQSLPMDTPISMDGVETVCTGIGDSKDDPRWKSYPVRIEFSNGSAQYLAGAHVTLSGEGKTLASFDCLGSWVLFMVPAGSYKVTAALTEQQGGAPRSAVFQTSGQPPTKRVVLQFSRIPANE